MAKKCTKCGKDSRELTPVLMMGPNGFRRYPVCAKCMVNNSTFSSGVHTSDTTGGGTTSFSASVASTSGSCGGADRVERPPRTAQLPLFGGTDGGSK